MNERVLTLQKICDIIGVPVPSKCKDMKDVIVDNVATRYKDATKGCYFFIMPKEVLYQMPMLERLEWLEKVGVRGAFIDENEYEEYNLSSYKGSVPLFPVEDVNEKACHFFSYIKETNNVKTIAVTGTCGKTTTMRFLKNIVPNHFETYMNRGNANSYMSVANNIMNNLKPKHEVYIQETGAADVDSLRKSAMMLAPDAFILLNVFDHHLSDYITFENLFRDKISFDDFLKEGGVVVANYDDERVAAHTFKHDVITLGINTEEDVDYRAINIEQNEGVLDMDVVYKTGSTHVSVSILGTQNAYNVLAAFALCKWLEIGDEDIVKGLKKYISSGYRQNFRKVAGYNLLLDCYNICEDSLIADLKTIRDIHVSNENKRIAVITGENRLGEDAEEKSFELGKALDLNGIDHVICVGVAEETEENIYKHCHTRPLYEGIKSTGYENVVYVTDGESLDKAVSDIVEEGDLILYKGIYSMDLAPSVDRVFGTAISWEEPHYSANSKEISTPNFVFKKAEEIKGLIITECKKKNMTKLTIPNRHLFTPIHVIAPKLFKDKKDINVLDLGKSVITIGRHAFYGCSSIEKLTIPSNVKVIERRAFARCSSIKSLVVEEGVSHIGDFAFANCNELKSAYIPDSVRTIGIDAFKDCKDLIIYCSHGSVADKYAQENGIVVDYR